MVKKQVKEEIKTNNENTKNGYKTATILLSVIIWTAIVLGVGFFVGQNYANDKHESVKREAKSIVSNLN